MGVRSCVCGKLAKCVMCASLATVILFEAGAYRAGPAAFDLDQSHRGQVAFNAFAGTSTSSVLNSQASMPAAIINTMEGEDFNVLPASDQSLTPDLAPFYQPKIRITRG